MPVQTLSVRIRPARLALALLSACALATCARDEVREPAPSASDADAMGQTAAFAPPAALLPPATGCAPGARCLSVTGSGRPSASGTYVAQCRGRFADFIVPKATLRSSYAGPWFRPNLLEQAATGIPSGTRPWRQFDPRDADEQLAYAMALRNYALTSAVTRGLTPGMPANSNYADPLGGTVSTTLRNQKWYPAPRMFYGPTDAPGTREAAHGMTLERTVRIGELGGNTRVFRNYAVAYYDARGGRVFQQLWNATAPGVDTPRLDRMRFAEHSFVYKLLFSAAPASAFPRDLLAGALQLDILPDPGGPPVRVRLMQIDIAVKDARAGATGWVFATYAYDRDLPGNSPWRKMAPVGLMWGNDPGGPPLSQSWINPDAPQYARDHLGVDGRLNGPVDNPASACMSCHATAQAPVVASMLPSGACAATRRADWFRNLSGSTPFGRRQNSGGSCLTAQTGLDLRAADYSLQMAATVDRALDGGTYNPCTWDEDAPPTDALVAPRNDALRRGDIEHFKVSRDPTEE